VAAANLSDALDTTATMATGRILRRRSPPAVANYLVLTKVDADPALSAEQSRPKGRLVLPIFIRQGWPQAMSHLP
jgi:hypothetical protein